MSDSLRSRGLYPTRLFRPWDSPIKNTGVGCHFLLQWGGRNTANITGLCGECSQCLGHTGFAHAHGMCVFLVYTAQAPGCSAGELSKVGPGFHALPKSKPFRFRFSGTPQRHKLSWACILCPSQVLAGQVTRCLVRAHPPSSVHLITSPIPAAQFPGCAVGVPSQVCCVSLLGS